MKCNPLIFDLRILKSKIKALQGVSLQRPNYVLSPSLTGYTANPFCVAKYEMKVVGGTATSQAKSKPTVLITRNSAKTKCSELGSGYALMTNDEWQTVARNIEGISSNWGGGTVGSAQGLSIGTSTATSSIQAASEDDNKACEGITLGGDTCDSRNWHAKRRTFTLSNKQVVWDLAGNAWERMKDDNDQNYGPHKVQISLITAGSHPVLRALSRGTTTTPRNTKDQFGPAGDYSSLTTDPWGGLGKAYIINNAGTFSRGGGITLKGLFSVDLTSSETEAHNGYGFRCVYHPPSD